MEGCMSHAAASPVPRSPLACLSELWSRVLFPGTQDNDTPWRWPTLLVLVILPGLLLYPCLSFYLFEPDEGRYAEIPREMLQRGEWVVPYLQGEPYLDKPPLLYWLVMLSYQVFGVSDGAARLVPALAVHACILITYLIGRRGLGERAAFWGALLLTLTPGLLAIGRLLVIDGVLTLWVTLAILCTFEATRTAALRWRWWWAGAVACGLGILTKGPVALVLLLPPLWLHRRGTGSGAALPWRSRLVFLGVVALVALPWYVAFCLAMPEFARHFLWQHNVVRFLAPFDHLQPVWFYLPILALGLLPVTPLLLPFARFLGCGDAQTAAKRCPALGFMLLAALWCVLFFSLSGCKLPTYILPAFPFLALALGAFLARTPWQEYRSVHGLLAVGLLMQLIGNYLVVPWYAEYRSPLSQWPTLAAHCKDQSTPVICYPRMCHSVAFYLGREDVSWFRSKEVDKLRNALREQPRTVLLLSHRHSLAALKQALPPELEIRQAAHFGLPPVPGVSGKWGRDLAKALGETALGLSDLAVVSRAGQPEPAGFEEAEPLLEWRPGAVSPRTK
jgi:4-amino-4-deoxy-L-arabinose transferase-like glycosyltransferase